MMKLFAINEQDEDAGQPLRTESESKLNIKDQLNQESVEADWPRSTTPANIQG